MDTLKWYAYVHVNGTLHVKRYFGDYGDIQEAIDSPFVSRGTGPFSADHRGEAVAKAAELLEWKPPKKEGK